MNRLLSALAGVAVLAGPAASQARDTSIRLDAVVAVVGNTAITAYDVERKLADSVALLAQRRAPMPNRETQIAWAKAALNELVDEEVLVLKAKEMQIEITDAEVGNAIDNIVKNASANFPSQQEFRRALSEAGYGTPEEYRRTMTTAYRRSRQIEELIKRLRSENKIPAVVVPETKVQEEFESLKAAGKLMKRATTVAWRQMVIAPTPSAEAKATAKAKAESLRAEIKGGGDFERIAKRESMDAATKDLGGDLGWRKRGDLPLELERVLFGPFTIRQGEISQVIESPFGFHLLRLDRANPPAEVKVRQILIMPRIDSADVARARMLADSLVGALRRGVSFDTIARIHHDRAEDAPGLIPEQPIDSLPASYQAGLKDVKKDSIVAFPIPALGFQKFVIAQVSSTSEPGEYTYDEVKSRIRFQLQQILQTRKYIDSQRKSVFVQLFPDRVADATRIFSTGR
jgi:parvulin-like peptidyl-prolyl isomerase